MKSRLLPVTCAILLSAGSVWAQDSKQGWSNESEVALVTTSGNTETESYSGKQKTTYVQDLNSYVLSGRYLQTKTGGVETANSWDAAGRYERSVSTNWSAFLQYGAEADPYAGYIQRDNADIGGKYFIFKEDTLNLFAEAGYRSTNTQFAGAPAATPPVPGSVERENFGRLYVEYAQQLNETVSIKYWVEYLPNFTNSNAYFVNTEPSATVMLSSIFSLKTAYLIKYRNEVVPGAEYADRTFTTSIVAKF